LHGLPGFTRRLVLQLLLESERVTVAVRADCPLHQGAPGMMWQAPRHPRHGTGHQNQLLMLRAQSTCGDILKLMTSKCVLFLKHCSHRSNHGCIVPGSLLPLIGSDQRSEGPDMRKELWDAGLGLADQLSVAAGVTARDKRAKEAKNSATSSSGGQANKNNTATNTLLAAKYYCLHHKAWPSVVLPVNVTMAQLLTALHYKGESLSSPGIALTLSHNPPGEFFGPVT
jgi:baculoviral IAP repeat-containing protein 6